MTHTAVIITRNRPDELRRCVAHLAAQSCPPDTILIIDASDRTVAADALGVPPDMVRVVAAAPGICSQRNMGLDLADTDIVSFFDDDVVLKPGYCAAMLDAFERDGERAIAGIAGVVREPRRIEGAELLVRRCFLLQTGRGCSRFRVSGIPDVGYDCIGPTEIPFAATTAVSYRRRSITDARFDDAQLGGAVLGLPTGRVFGEDLLFSLQVAARGERILMIPTAQCTHRPSVHNREDVFVTQALYVRSLRVLSRRAARGALQGIARRWALVGQLLLCVLQSLRHRNAGYVRGWWRAMTR